MKALKYAVIGTGAIGGYYGSKLAKVGKEVHFLFRSDYEYVKENGLTVDSIAGDYKICPINAYSSVNDMPVCDVILVALKTTNNYQLKKLLPPLLHKDSVVILIQNGLGMEEDLKQDFPTLHIAGGVAYICSDKINPGQIRHLDKGGLTIASYSCPDNSILDQVCTDFNNADVKAKIQDLNTARWSKLIWNIPFNGMTVVLNTTTKALVNSKDTAFILRKMMQEIIDAANLLTSTHFSEKIIDAVIEDTIQMIPYSPSMKVDYDFKRPLEIGYIYTRPILEGEKVGKEMPYIRMLEKQLRFIEQQYK